MIYYEFVVGQPDLKVESWKFAKHDGELTYVYILLAYGTFDFLALEATDFRTRFIASCIVLIRPLRPKALFKYDRVCDSKENYTASYSLFTSHLVSIKLFVQKWCVFKIMSDKVSL